MYEEFFSFALGLFNEKMDATLCPELVLVTRKNIVRVFNETITRIGADREPVSFPSYLNGMAAEALVGGERICNPAQDGSSDERE